MTLSIRGSCGWNSSTTATAPAGAPPTTCGAANDSTLEVAKGAEHLDLLRELIGADVDQIKTIPGLVGSSHSNTSPPRSNWWN